MIQFTMLVNALGVTKQLDKAQNEHKVKLYERDRERREPDGDGSQTIDLLECTCKRQTAYQIRSNNF